MALSVIVICSGQTFVQHLVMLQYPIPSEILQFFQPVFSVNWVHFQGSGVNEESRSDELVMKIVFPKDMADILAEEALNTLPKLLDVVNVFLFHPPRTIFGIRGSWRETVSFSL